MTLPLTPGQLRWTCDPARLPFATTRDVTPISGVVGQSLAIEALRYGLESDAGDQNVFVRGIVGSGRMTLIRRLIDELRLTCPIKIDRCYVHNFDRPDRPRLVSLPAGQGRLFRSRMLELAAFVRDGLPEALQTDLVKARRDALQNRAQQSIESLTRPFEAALREADLGLVNLQHGNVKQTAIVPLVDGQPTPPEQLEELRAKGRIDDAYVEAYRKNSEAFLRRLAEVSEKIGALQRETGRAIRAMLEETARSVLGDQVQAITREFPGEDVRTHLAELVSHVVEVGLGGGDASDQLYGVNVLLEHSPEEDCPVVVENTPTLANLLGSVDRDWKQQNPLPDYRSIRAGSLLRADGGFLIVDARDLLSEPGAWKVMTRTLRSGSLEIVPPEIGWHGQAPAVKPEPIPLRIRVVLVGDAPTYYALDGLDPDFANLFKVLADFETVIDRAPDGANLYAGVLARIAEDEHLPPFDRGAVARLVEHGARVAARRGKLTARFGRIADIAREAAFLARKAAVPVVTAEHVTQAVSRTKQRAILPSRRFLDLIGDGTIRIETEGARVGQINGLAVMQAGPLTYGFPARITASIGAGSAGIIDIEGSAALGGAIHTKGFQILGGLLRSLLQADHPLAFSASLAFEQSYGGIDGDSASTAEICCLLSALTGTPLRQSLAITGAIDQIGHVQAIGGVNEKIEGFFDVCAHRGLTGDQGVIIPAANVGDLMLRPDVVAACAEGRFAVHAVDTVQQALELLTGTAAGERRSDGRYPPGTLLGHAVTRAREFWSMAMQTPPRPTASTHIEAEPRS